MNTNKWIQKTKLIGKEVNVQIIKSKEKTDDTWKLGKSRKPSWFKNLGINKMNLLNLSKVEY